MFLSLRSTEVYLVCNKKTYSDTLWALRLLSECLILIGSAMFGATFNLVTRVGLPYF